MNDNEESIDIRSIQQYLYCPRRFALIVNECSWSENVFVTKGNLIHQRVDEGKHTIHSNGIILRDQRVYNDELGIFGVIDCLELNQDDNGVAISGYKGKYKACIIEYKPTAPKSGDYRYEDSMQLLAQKICIDALFETDCETYFYYDNTRRRVKIDFDKYDYEYLKKTLSEIRNLKKAGYVPKKRLDQYCGGCSMYDICMPKGSEVCENY